MIIIVGTERTNHIVPSPCFFVADLHGSRNRFGKLFERIAVEKPRAVFIGGDILPAGIAYMASKAPADGDFIRLYLRPECEQLQATIGDTYPHIFIILGNDDGRFEEDALIEGDNDGLWSYVHDRKVMLDDHPVYGYACIPPSPFQLKDWERYDVSRFVDPGAVSPEEGYHSTAVSKRDLRYRTIAEDLTRITGNDDMSGAIMLFHSPPHKTKLDLADLAGKMYDHAPLDPHVGSIAIRRFIEKRQPLVTLHGHVHDSTRLTGSWRDMIGTTHMFNAAHDGPELCLIRFDPADLANASRELIL